MTKRSIRRICLEIAREYLPLYISGLRGKKISLFECELISNRLSDRKILSILNSSKNFRNFVINETARVIKYIEERKKRPAVKIKVENPGVLEVPEGKKVNELPFSHFAKLAKKKGVAKVVRALNNIKIWNKRRNPTLSRWAERMQNKVSALNKD